MALPTALVMAHPGGGPGNRRPVVPFELAARADSQGKRLARGEVVVAAGRIWIGRDVLVDRPAVELVDEIQRVVLVEREPFMGHAWNDGPPDEVAAVRVRP